MRIQMIGLGPGNPEDLTLRAAEALLSGRRVMLRTERHPVADWLQRQGVAYTSLDTLYETAEDFDALTEASVKMLREEAEAAERAGLAPLIFAVPGHGWLEEDAAPLMAAGLEPELVPGISSAMVPGTPYSDWSAGLTMLPAAHVSALKHRTPGPLLVTQLDDVVTAGEVKLTLAELWGDEAEALYTNGQGVSQRIPLYTLDRQQGFDHNARLLLEAPAPDTRGDVDTLRQVVETLRAPLGCPWDRAQTHESLSRFMLEEALEVQDAIAGEDMEALCAELGDVLLLVVFHASLGAEEDAFDLEDVADAACRKMRRRHPQLFGLGEAVEWEEMKRRETGDTTVTAAMEGLASTLPALLRAEKVQYKAGNVGFDWENAALAMEKVREEAGEVLAAADPEETRDEVGDLLFSVVNVARLLGVEPEEALRLATDKFIRRFGRMEALAAKKGQNLAGMSLDDMNALWEKVKEEA